MQGDQVLEYAIGELIEEGEVQRHIRRARREYEARRDVLASELKARLGNALTFSVPLGGIALWVKAADDIDIEAWSVRAHANGAVMITARTYALDRRAKPFARLGFASLNRKELAEAVRRLAIARPRH
jgi:GntR family transcriptional regulator/MocR family aminotransferase